MIEGFKNRLKFLIERLLVRGPHYRLLLMAMLVALLSITGGLLVFLFDGRAANPADSVWWAFLRLTDPGYLGDDEGTLRRVVSTFLTVMGYVVFMGALIAILTQWLNSTVQKLELGLTPISMRRHLVVLGWTNRTPDMVRDLLKSEDRVRRFLQRRGLRRLRLAILAEEITPSVGAELREHLGHPWEGERIILRSGTPLRTEHLRRVDALRASVVIVPADDSFEGGQEQADIRAIKAILTLAQAAGDHWPEGERPLLVAEMFDPRKMPVARGAYDGPIEIIAGNMFIGRMLAQAVRHRGATLVFHELLTHEFGNELYLRDCPPEYVGKPFRQVATAYGKAVLLGVKGVPEDPAILNPPEDFLIREGDRLVTVAPDFEDTVSTRAISAESVPTTEHLPFPSQERTRRVLLLGWSHRAVAFLAELESYTKESFDVTILSLVSSEQREAEAERDGYATKRVKLRHVEGDYTLPEDIREVAPESFDNIVFLSSDRLGSEERSDARTLVGWLLLTETLAGADAQPDVLVELLSGESAPLIEKHGHEVFISAQLMSHVLVQVSLRRELNEIFNELTGAGGMEIVFRAASELKLAGKAVRFDDIQFQARAAGETAIGLRLAGNGKEPEMVLNPDRAKSWSMGEADEVILVAAAGEE